MGDPELKAKRSAARKRNFIAKRMLEEKKPKVHISEKDREKQRKWRREHDPELDYENLDDWLTR
jgi:hypothetical protein